MIDKQFAGDSSMPRSAGHARPETGNDAADGSGTSNDASQPPSSGSQGARPDPPSAGADPSDGTSHDRQLILSGLAMIAVAYGLARFSYGLFLPQFRDVFRLGPALLGLIAGGSYLGYCIAIMIAGALSPRLGPRRVVVLAGLVAATGLALVAGASNGVMLAVGVLLAGMSTGLASPPMGDAVKLKVATARQDAANTWINSGTSLGVLGSAPVALWAAADWRYAWAAFAAVALAVTFWCARTLPGRPYSTPAGDGPAAWRIGPRAAWLLTASFTMGLVSAIYWTFSRELIATYGDVSTTVSMVFWMVIGVAGFLGGLAGRFVLRCGLTFALRTSLLGLGLATALLGAAPGSAVAAFASATTFGALYIMLTGIFLVWSVAVYERRPSLGIAISFMVIAVGQAVGSPIAGAVVGATDLTVAFGLFGAIGVGSALLRPHAVEARRFPGTRQRPFVAGDGEDSSTAPDHPI